MCGIVGFTGTKNPAQITVALKSIANRGRDEDSIFSQNNINLGMTRLSIVDLQPKLFPMRYKHYVLVYNGEIYNYAHLKSKLEKAGITFRSKNDGEVILPLFDRYKEKAFAMLDGMFAIAIYDTRRQKLYLARDKMGEKPLYYTQYQDQLYFASELKAVLKLTPRRDLNHAVLGEYLSQGFVFAPHTLVNNVFCLKRGQCVCYSQTTQSFTRHEYWSSPISTLAPHSSTSDLIDELEGLLDTTVKSRLMADVPIGTFLSGGIDSSLITFFATIYKKDVNTYSVTFPHHPKNDERIFAQKASQWLSTRHHEIVCTPSSVKPIVENIGSLIDHPISDPACLPTYLLAHEARKAVKVVLTGEGADEIFGGYHHYWKELLAHKFKNSFGGKILQPATALLAKKFGRLQKITTTLATHYNTQGIFNAQEVTLLLGHPSSLIMPGILTKYSLTNPLLGMQLTDMTGYLPEQLFMKVDKMTMANNLEARAPFVSPDIVAFGLALPEYLKAGLFQGKWLLKKIAEKHFPKYMVWRPKHGFTLPLGEWLNGELSFVLRELTLLLPSVNYLNPGYYHNLIEGHRGGKANHADKIWTLYVLLKWMHEYKIKD
ncbi:asparagine synthase (glutamine-hydrolyzing) [Microgenomates group bacterium RIFCSPLOWO2_01_FULL_47_10]|nr:MAG: asparagine synthase (glutamine-hydrolyzing) [Microgenomates group bacterium RIFCSPLOWO2_01_FULL_47_10]